MPAINGIETEKRAFNIDPVTIESRLKEAGARYLGNLSFRRAVLDTIPANPNRWIRVRTDGTNTTMAVKERINNSAEGTREVEIVVDDYDKTLEILSLIGVNPRSIQENRRTNFELPVDESTVEVSIDEWPLVGHVLEIEAQDERLIDAAAQKIGISVDSLTGKTIEAVYADMGIDVKTIPVLKFE